MTNKVKVPSVFAGKAWQQVLARDARADGQFVYAVKTTKVFCRPSCSSRRPERKNVTFFPTPEQAAAAGYRACQVCRPEEAARKADPQQAAIEAVSSYLTEHATERTKLKDVAKATGVAPLTILRGFKRALGVSPREYAKAQRVEVLKQKRAAPKEAGTNARGGAGDEGSAEVHGEAERELTPSAMKAGAKGEVIRYALADSPLDRMLVAATARGVCAVAFGEEDLDLLRELQGRYPHAELKRRDGELGQEVRAVIAVMEERPGAGRVEMDVRMTAFQQRVWEALRAIPRGETRTYGELARELGTPRGAQAVGRAVGSNPLAVLVPCHRVVGAAGEMTGYRWGVERKRALLGMEGLRKGGKQIPSGMTTKGRG